LRQKILTAKEKRRFLELGCQDGEGGDAIVVVHFFYGTFDWYATEYDERTGLFFGWVKSPMCGISGGEWGSFSAREFQGTPVERDLHWTEKRLREVSGYGGN